MKMPNLASVNQDGVGRLSTDSQVGSYPCATANTPPKINNGTTRFNIGKNFLRDPYSHSEILLRRLRPLEHCIMLRREVFDEDLILFWGELCPPTPAPGAFASEVIGEDVPVPMSELIVGSTRRKT